MKVFWSKLSQTHLQALFNYIAEENESAARNLVVQIVKITETILTTHPKSGRPGRVSGTRELVIVKTPYIISYEIDKNSIVIIAVWHSSRRWPKKFN